MKNQILKLVLFVFVAAFAVSCQEDPLDGIISHDRQFLSFKIDGQVGPAIIKPIGEDAGTIELFALINNVNLNSVSPVFEVSEKASISPKQGEAVSFDNENNAFTYQIVSESGETRAWTVIINTYDSTLDGSWKVSSLLYDWHIGLYQDWGWGVFGAYDAATSSYDPDNYAAEVLSGDLPNAAFEEDNTLEFTTLLINENGNPEGSFSFGAGEDSTFSSFVLDPDHNGGVRDYSHRYRQMPEGNGVWEYNELGKVITLWEGNKNGPSVEGKVTVDAQGNITIAFEIWIDSFTWDHWGAESHIQSAYTMYYNFEADNI